MRRVFLCMVATAFVFSFTSCTNEPAAQTSEALTQTSTERTSEVIQTSAERTSEVTQTHETKASSAETSFIYKGMDEFFADPELFIWQNFLLLPGMNEIANSKDLFPEEGQLPITMVYRENVVGYDTGNPSSDGKAYYMIYLPAEQNWDLEKLAGVIGGALGITYELEYIEASPGGASTSYWYAYAEGSESGYSGSRINLNNPNTGEGYCSVDTFYYETSGIYKSLADECFSRDVVSLPEALEDKQYAVEIVKSYPESGLAYIVSKIWPSLSGEEVVTVKEWISQRGFAVSLDYSDTRKEYWLALDDKYYHGIRADVFNMGTNEVPKYRISISILING